MQTSQPRLIIQMELAAFLNVTKPTIIKLRKQGCIPFMKIGSIIRYDFDEVIKTFKQNSSK